MGLPSLLLFLPFAFFRFFRLLRFWLRPKAALRQIGKRNLHLNALAVQTAEGIRRIESSAARWIASDALRELTSARVQARLTR